MDNKLYAIKIKEGNGMPVGSLISNLNFLKYSILRFCSLEENAYGIISKLYNVFLESINKLSI